MNFTAQSIGYQQTGYFNKLIADYISGNSSLRPFYNFPVSAEGIKASIHQREQFNTNRKLLADVLEKQYSGIHLTQKQQLYIDQLKENNTFTICTAHQPNIFTGPLYFIYKILHVIKMAESFSDKLSSYHFVPVFYMGSEDADLDELGHVFISGEKFDWKTAQTGAIGRMKIDKELLSLIERIEGQLSVYPFGKEIIETIKKCYTENSTIEQATFKLVNELFAEYGLIVLLPDNSLLKKEFAPVIQKELRQEFSHPLVAQTVAAFPSEYKVEATGRELNLFYLKDDKRERIEKINGKFKTKHEQWNDAEMEKELLEHPGRFSPNVILRPVFQEAILPNIAFVGGAGEIAYWLELKKVFEAVNVPYPMLILRNSFMVVCKDREIQAKKLGLTNSDLFKKENELFNEIVKKDAQVQLDLEQEKKQLNDLYQKLKNISSAVDPTLAQHTEALQVQALKRIGSLEKKMLRAEKKKFEAQQRQLHKLKTQLFPNDNLQERVDNIMIYYAKWGKGFIRSVYKNSSALEQQFTVLTEIS